MAHTRTRAVATAATTLLMGALVAGLPGGAAAQSSSPASYGVDDGTHITMWTRAATQDRADQLVKAYNATHKNQVDVDVRPHRRLPTKVGAAAAAADGLPDLFSADVVFMPNWTSAGLFTDITDKIATLPYAADIAQAAIDVSTWDGKKYGLPVRRRPLGLDVQQGPVPEGRPGPREAAHDPRGVRRRRASVASSVATSTAPSSAATAAAARSSPGGPSRGPTARRS